MKKVKEVNSKHISQSDLIYDISTLIPDLKRK